MKEIGGYLELEEAHGTEYHKNAIALNSGRHCLEYLIKAKNIKKLYIPYFLCASVKNLCGKCNCEYEFYHISNDFSIIFDGNLDDNEYLYIVNYYGQVTNEKILCYKQRFKNIIIDNTQAFFQYPIDNVDTLYTCRKFFGVTDGGYLYTDKKICNNLETDISYERFCHILGRFEKTASEFYDKYSSNEKIFANCGMKYMSKITHNLMRCIDYDFTAKRRSENFEYLHEHLNHLNKLDLIIPYGAFMYPLYIENGTVIKKRLIDKKIFVPTLWSDVFNIANKGTVEYDLAKNIVPLPIDQRYNEKDMNIIIRNILGDLNER